jgi:putative signal transducing protein
MTQQWVLLTKVFTGLDVDTIRGALELEGIPALVRGFGVGIFGGGYQGPINDGAEILVPEMALERAREIIPGTDPELDSFE